MIYVDSSVVLAELLGEARRPPEALWDGRLTSSALTLYEVWNRLNARDIAVPLAEATAAVLQRLWILELNDLTLRRALDPFPTPLRTLDALHLAAADYLRQHGDQVTVATYDTRLATAARALQFVLEPL